MSAQSPTGNGVAPSSLTFSLIPPPGSAPKPTILDDGRTAEDFAAEVFAIKASDFLSMSAPLSSGSRFYEGCREIHESDIRNAVLVEGKRRKYWGTKTVERMEFEDIQHSCCYHYALESFTETRSTADATEPFVSSVAAGSNGESLDALMGMPGSSGGGSGMSQRNPWDYEVLPTAEFVGQTRVLELPSTSQLVPCQTCNSEGVSHCFHCRGFGTDKCGYCRGTGMKAGVAHPAIYTHPMVATFPHSDQRLGGYGMGGLGGMGGSGIVRPPPMTGNRPYAVGTPVHFMAKAGLPPPGIGQHDLCIFCQGRGIRDCHHCKGQGKRQCGTCAGHGTVRQYIKLKVFFAVEKSDFYTGSELPEVVLRAATGEVSLCETANYVMPVKKFPIKEINEVSKKLCSQHMQKSLGACRVIKQRQTVEAIPVARVQFRIKKKNKTGVFYVFGNERLCHIPKSPSKCSIM